MCVACRSIHMTYLYLLPRPQVVLLDIELDFTMAAIDIDNSGEVMFDELAHWLSSLGVAFQDTSEEEEEEEDDDDDEKEDFDDDKQEEDGQWENSHV